MINGTLLSKFKLFINSRVLEPYLISHLSTRKMSDVTKDIINDPRKALGLLGIFKNNPKRFKRINFLGGLFKDAGYELRLAGGAVRDILRGVEPQDIDFATDARPEQSLQILEPHEDRLRIIVTAAGQKHGTVAVKFKEIDEDTKRIKLSDTNLEMKGCLDRSTLSEKKPEYDEESPFEITTLRCDNITDGRHAEVEFVNDWRIDAERRDLTINAMFLTLEEGKLIDYFGGESDLKNGVVRFVGSADMRMKEDYLRILRFFRFWSRYGCDNSPDRETIVTIASNLDGLDKISGERLWQETKKILIHVPCKNVVKLMLEIKLFGKLGLTDSSSQSYEEYQEAVLNDLEVVQANIMKFSQEVLSTIQKEDPDNKVCKKMKEMLPVILFTSLLQSFDMCMSANERMKFSNDEKSSMLYIIENRLEKPNLRSLKYQLAMSHYPKKTKKPQVPYEMRAYLIYMGLYEMIEELETWSIPYFPITGDVISREIRQRKLSVDKIKFVQESLKKEWATNDYKQDQAQLHRSMLTTIEELERNRSQR